MDVRVADLQCARNLQKSTLQRYRNSRVDVGITNLECELKFAASTIQRDKNWRVDVGVTNLQCNSKFAKSTIQRYTDSRVDVGLTNLQCPWNFLSLPYEDTIFQKSKTIIKNTKNKGGRWRYRLTLSLKFARSTIQTILKTIKDGRWRYKLTVSLKFAKSTIHSYKSSTRYTLTVSLKKAKSTMHRYNKFKGQRLPHHKGTQNQGWKLALQTYSVYSVLDICKVYGNKDIKTQGWTLTLQTHSMVEICTAYHTQMKNSRVDAIQGGRWCCKLTVSSKFATSTIHGYTHSRVDVGDTNSQCPWSLQRLPYKDTEIQGWTLALQNLQCNLKFARSTIQRYTDSWVDASVTNLQCPWKLKMSTIQRCKHSRVDVGVTRMQWVRETCKAYHTKIHKFKGGRWRCKLTVR